MECQLVRVILCLQVRGSLSLSIPSYIFLQPVQSNPIQKNFKQIHYTRWWDPKMCCQGYVTKLYLMVKLQFWRFEECGVPLSLPLLPGSLGPGVGLPVMVLSIGQIELFNHLIMIIIIICYLKTCSCMKIIYIT